MLWIAFSWEKWWTHFLFQFLRSRWYLSWIQIRTLRWLYFSEDQQILISFFSCMLVPWYPYSCKIWLMSPHLYIRAHLQIVIYFVLAIFFYLNYLFIHSPLIFPLSSPCWCQMNSSFCRSSAGNGLMQLEYNYCSVRRLGWPLYLKNKRIEKYPAAKSQEEKVLTHLVHFHHGSVCSFAKVSCERETIKKKKEELKWRWNKQKCCVWDMF